MPFAPVILSEAKDLIKVQDKPREGSIYEILPPQCGVRMTKRRCIIVSVMPPKVLKHFKKCDPKLYAVMMAVGELQSLPNRETKDYFVNLVDSIIGQQLSGKVVDIIFARFKKLFKDGKITPQAVLKLSDEKIRDIGVSYSKIKYIKDLAQKVKAEELDLDHLETLADEEVVTELVKVKGIGRWTAEMFLMFTLKREDIFSHGDLGLNNAIKKIYKLPDYSQERVEKLVLKWSPYKSYASRTLWRSLDNR